MFPSRVSAALLCVAAASSTTISAGPEPESTLDRLWSLPVLYQDNSNPALQEFALIGQLQLQYASGFDDDNPCGTRYCPEAGNWGDIEVRRFRFGAKARFLEMMKFHTLVDLEPDFEPRIYKRLVETVLTCAPHETLQLSAGKTELKFTREQEISSREILTFERSQLVNMFYGGELTGAWVSGRNVGGRWFYEAGAYANDRRDEWPDFNGGTILLGKLGHDLTRQTGLERAEAGIHYLHNTEPGYQGDPRDPASPPYSDCISLYGDFTEGRFGLLTQLFWGDGEAGRPDACGISLLPTWFLTERLQWVGLFELAGSREDNGILLPSRYEGQAPGLGDKSGDLYFSAYSGLNYYLHGHKLKLMTGVKFAALSGGSGGGDYDGWTWLAGMRVAF